MRGRRLLAAGGSVLALLVASAGLGTIIYTAGGLGSASGNEGPDPSLSARAFVKAWIAGDYRAMYRRLTPRSRHALSYAAFAARYRHAARVASLRKLVARGDVRVYGRTASVSLQAHTALFGTLHDRFSFAYRPVGKGYGVVWQPRMVLPDLLPGERLVRRSRLPKRRGAIFASGGSVLAQGPASARSYPQGSPFAVVTGYLKPASGADVGRRAAQGWPASAPYGQGGLEQSLERVLAGRPEIMLVAAGRARRRVLGRHPGAPPRSVRTTLSLRAQSVATDALGGRYGGVVVLDAHSGAVLASAGLGMDVLQPPGSTFKMVTASAALATGVASLSSSYADAREVVLDGWHLKNYHHELCGGSLTEAFAVSCNSVFAPLADEVGARRLVHTATAFGFNRAPSLAYPAPESVTPAPSSLGGDLATGVAGIGQGGVTATPLQMASVAQTIAEGGVLHRPWLVKRPRAIRDRRPSRRVVSPAVASDVAGMMRAVVAYGTGVHAALPGITVAGKTGTAELGPGIKDDAWFAGFAPAEAPRLVVCVLVIHGGVGGDAAAPIAASVLAGLL